MPKGNNGALRPDKESLMFDTDHNVDEGGFFFASGITDFEVRYIGRIHERDLPERMQKNGWSFRYTYFLSGGLFDTNKILFFYEGDKIFDICMDVTDLQTMAQIHGPFVCDLIGGFVEEDLFEIYSHVNDREVAL